VKYRIDFTAAIETYVWAMKQVQFGINGKTANFNATSQYNIMYHPFVVRNITLEIYTHK